MKRIILFLFISFNILFSKEVTLTLDSAIEMALKNNRLNRVSQLNLELAKAQYQQALSANYPSLDAIVYANRDKKDNIFQQRGTFTLSSATSKTFALSNTIGMSDVQAAVQGAAMGNPTITNLGELQTFMAGLPASSFPEGSISADIDTVATGRDTVRGELQLNYPVYTGGKISAIIEQARLNKHIKKQDIIRDKNSVIFDVRKYFYAYILTNELYILVDEIYEKMKFSRDLTKEFLENGTELKINRTDYLNVKLLTTLIQSTLSKIELNKKMLEGAITNVIGLKYSDKINIKYDEQKILKQNSSLQKLVKKALSLNPDVNSISLALKVKDEQIKEAGSSNYPMVNLFGNVSHTYNSYEYGYLSEDEENRWNLGIAIKMSLFDGFKTKNSVIERKLDKKVVQEQKELLEEGLALQLKNEFLRSSIGYKQIGILSEAVQTAEESSKMNFKGYQYEIVEAEQLVQSQLMEVYVKADYLKNVHDYLLSLARIDKLVGEKVDEGI